VLFYFSYYIFNYERCYLLSIIVCGFLCVCFVFISVLRKCLAEPFRENIFDCYDKESLQWPRLTQLWLKIAPDNLYVSVYDCDMLHEWHFISVCLNRGPCRKSTVGKYFHVCQSHGRRRDLWHVFNLAATRQENGVSESTCPVSMCM